MNKQRTIAAQQATDASECDVFVFDGHEYHDYGRIVCDCHDNELMTVVLDYPAEYWIAEAANGEGARVHVNEHDARMTAIKSLLASDDC